MRLRFSLFILDVQIAEWLGRDFASFRVRNNSTNREVFSVHANIWAEVACKCFKEGYHQLQ